MTRFGIGENTLDSGLALRNAVYPHVRLTKSRGRPEHESLADDRPTLPVPPPV